MKLALYGGSFNPIHNGHLILANYAKHELKLNKVIFVTSFSTPGKSNLINPHQREQMVYLALMENNALGETNSVEIDRGRVSYTIDTVLYFKKKYPEDELFLICGPDVFLTIDDWKNINEIRGLINIKIANHDFYCPDVSIRSTQIRKLIRNKKPISYLVPKSVEKFIIKNNLYGENNEHFL